MNNRSYPVSDTERLKKLFEQARIDVDNLQDWMKSQEPAPGVSYEEWVRSQQDAQNRPSTQNRRVARAYS